MGKGYISTAFLEFAKAHNIPIYWINSNGLIEASFLPFIIKNLHWLLNRLKQEVTGKH